MRKQGMRFKQNIVKIVSAIAIMSVAFPVAVFAAAPSDWMQRYDITVIEPGGVANYMQRYRINIVYPVHLSLSTNSVEISATPGAAEPSTRSTEATVRTGWSAGYRLSVSGDEALVCKDDSGYTIPTISSDGSIATNTWGVGIGTDGSTPPSSWKGVTTVDKVLVEKNTTSNGGTAGPGDKYNIFFGTKVDGSMLACEYEGEVVFTAVMN